MLLLLLLRPLYEPRSRYAVNAFLCKERTFRRRDLTRLSEGDSVIEFERQNDDIVFTGQRVVETMAKTAGEEWEVTVGEPMPFSKPWLLSEYAGSLERVYRFLEPERHFRRHVVALSERDCHTIKQGLIDYQRTTFVYLFSALPSNLQIEFVQRQLTNGVPEPDGAIHDYRLLAEKMISFIEKRLHSSFALLSRVGDTAKELNERGVGSVPGLEKLYLASGEGKDETAFGESCMAASKLLETCDLFRGIPHKEGLLEELRGMIQEDNPEVGPWHDRLL